MPLSPSPRSRASSDRLRALDGLRGIAALMVVAGHTRIVLVQNYTLDWMTTPAPALISRAVGTLGHTAVWLFFVLSGFVLARMFTRGSSIDYGKYVLQRLLRLYVPVWAAVLLAVASMVVIPRDGTGLGKWVASHPSAISLGNVAFDLTLLDGTGGNVSPLWSLRWEILFSLLLIVYLAVQKVVSPILFAAACVLLSAVGAWVGNDLLLYMPMFGIGVAISAGWGSLGRVADRLARTPLAPFLSVMGMVVLVVVQFVPGYFHTLGIVGGASTFLSTLVWLCAVSGLVVLVALAPSLRLMFANRFMLWLGMISYSLYLTHEAVVLGLTYSTDANLVALGLAVALCLPVAWVFYLTVEKPAHKLAKRIRIEGTPVPEPHRILPSDPEQSSEPVDGPRLGDAQERTVPRTIITS